MYRTATLLLVTLATTLTGTPAVTAQAPRPTTGPSSLVVAPLDRPAIAREDDQRRATRKPTRFAIPHRVQASTRSHGAWDLRNARQAVWRLRIRAPGADHINLGFTEFQLPPRAELWIRQANGRPGLRPFTAGDNAPSRQLWTPVVAGEEIEIELRVPPAHRHQVALRLGQIGSGYRFFGAGRSALKTHSAGGFCDIDVVCSQGNPWRDEIASVAAFSTGGSIFCSGFMVNNTAENRRNYFMTALHCGVNAANAASIVVYWNYENSGCNIPNNGPLNQFSTGSTFRAGYEPSDFALVELFQTPNPAWGVSYAGWNRSSGDANSAVAIHHPAGDPKKISFENQSTSTTSYLGSSVPGDGTHVRVLDWDIGSTEGGSSGSPLFDQDHRVIGQLHGGFAACGNNDPDWYGRISVSWNGGGSRDTRLSDWLDPRRSGAMTLDTLSGTNLASAIPYGTGCIERFAAFFETFDLGQFDLSGSVSQPRVLKMTPSASGYLIENGASAWFRPTSTSLGLQDDDVSSPLTLPFSFRHPGGATAVVRMCSNGYLWLDGTSIDADYEPDPTKLVSQAARLCPGWLDLDPSSGGTTHFDVDPAGDAVYLTWLAVPEYFTSSLNDIQCVLRSTGTVEFRWRRAANTDGPLLVGYGPGTGSQRPSNRDISGTVPFRTQPDLAPLVLNPTSRPALGSTQTFRVENVPTGTGSGFLYLSLTQIAQGADLSVIGMPTCRLYGSSDLRSGFAVTGPTAQISLPVPNLPSLAGVHLFAQAATVSPGSNALGVVASNGVDLMFDQN